MASFNKFLLMGKLTRAPELRHTADGTPVADMRIAVNRTHTTPSGEQREQATFLTVVVWSKQAEAVAAHLDKGSPVFVEGRIQTQDWQDKAGQKRTTTEIVAQRVLFLASKRRGEAAAATPGHHDEEVPF